MRLDPDRLSAEAQEFAFPRQAETEGECRAASMVIESLTRAGWQVDVTNVGPYHRRRLILVQFLIQLLITGFLLLIALSLTLQGAWRPWRFVLTAGFIFVTAGLTGLCARRVGIRFLPLRSCRSRTVVASQPGGSEKAARVVLVTELSPLPSIWGKELMPPLSVLLGWLSLGTLVGTPFQTASESRQLLLVWIGFGVTFLSVIGSIHYWLTAPETFDGDNRTGLAVLLELARSLPERIHQRVEIRLAFCGACMGKGFTPLYQALRREEPRKPTLIVSLDQPGLGKELMLSGDRSAVELTRQAARDLWLPHRVRRSLGPRSRRSDPLVVMIGYRQGERQIEPAAMIAAAQLVQEIILRWAKQTAQAEKLSADDADQRR